MTRRLADVITGLFRMPQWQRPSRQPVVDGEHWVDDGSGEREVWSGHHMDELSPHSAWAHGYVEPAAEVPAPPTPEPATVAPTVREQVVYDVDWLAAKLSRQPRHQPGRHRAKAGTR